MILTCPVCKLEHTVDVDPDLFLSGDIYSYPCLCKNKIVVRMNPRFLFQKRAFLEAIEKEEGEWGLD